MMQNHQTARTLYCQKKPLNMLRTNLTGDEEITLEYNQSNAVFTLNDMVLSANRYIIDGKYPELTRP